MQTPIAALFESPSQFDRWLANLVPADGTEAGTICGTARSSYCCPLGRYLAEHGVEASVTPGLQAIWAEAGDGMERLPPWTGPFVSAIDALGQAAQVTVAAARTALIAACEETAE